MHPMLKKYKITSNHETREVIFVIRIGMAGMEMVSKHVLVLEEDSLFLGHLHMSMACGFNLL